MLAILALAVAGHGIAQEHNNSNGSPDGLYAVPDAKEGTAQESTANRAAQSYLSSLDSQGEKFKRDLEKVEAAQKSTISAQKAKNLAGDDFNWSAWMPRLSERVRIAILAGLGLFVSMAVGGYVWWSRLQNSKTNSAVLLSVTREPAAAADGKRDQDNPPVRRAA